MTTSITVPDYENSFPCLMELYTKQDQGFKPTGQIVRMDKTKYGFIVPVNKKSDTWYKAYGSDQMWIPANESDRK